MIFINLAGLSLIALIIWWFWLYQPRQVKAAAEDDFVVEVDNGIYLPAQIQWPQQQEKTLRFKRKDASPCAATVIFPDLEISSELKHDAITEIKLPPLERGEYNFHCPMQMYRGILIVS